MAGERVDDGETWRVGVGTKVMVAAVCGLLIAVALGLATGVITDTSKSSRTSNLTFAGIVVAVCGIVLWVVFVRLRIAISSAELVVVRIFRTWRIPLREITDVSVDREGLAISWTDANGDHVMIAGMIEKAPLATWAKMRMRPDNVVDAIRNAAQNARAAQP